MLTDADKERMRLNGTSEHEIAYYDAETQKEYEPLLKDPLTPQHVIYDIAERITLLPLKILALHHPNVTAATQRYILSKADKKPYQKELIEAFIANTNGLNMDNLAKIRKFYNTANRFDICVVELIESQSDIFTTHNLDIVFNILNRVDKLLERFLLAVFEHKNFNVSILDGDFLKKPGTITGITFQNAVFATKNKSVILGRLYENTGDPKWLPQEAKDIFLF